MEGCSPPLYQKRHGSVLISTFACKTVLYDIGNCDGSYLYFNGEFLYTMACPIEPTKQNKTIKSITRNATRNATQNTTQSTTQSTTQNTTQKTTQKTTQNTTRAQNATFNATVRALRFTADSAVHKEESGVPLYAVVLMSTCVGLALFFVAFHVVLKRRRKRRSLERRSSSIIPVIVDEEEHALREVRQTLKKIVSTICRWNGQYPYRHRAPPEDPPAPPVPPRPIQLPRPTKRTETLDYLRRHSLIENALSKPSDSVEDAGQRRAELIRREAALETQRAKRRRGVQRVKRIANMRTLLSKGHT